MKKSKLIKTLGFAGLALGAAFVGMSVVAKKQRPESRYDNKPEEKNPLEGKHVIFVPDDSEPENADGVRGHLEAVGESRPHPGFYNRYVKRGLDLVLSFGGLVALSPVMGAIALAIKIEDPGPALFTQKRLGLNKQYFKLHKFRSMKVSTPHDVPTHQLENPEQYITKVGKFIRAHSLDELPQIWDIFVGNMSVIGPRPGLWNQDLLTAERDKYGANDVKPGLTGWAQINGRDELEIPVKAKLDGDYAKQVGPVMDARCFLGSVGVFAGDESVVEGGTGEMKKADRKKKYLIVTNHSYMLYRFRKDLIDELRKTGEVVISTPFVGHEGDFEGCRMVETAVDRRGINPKTDLLLLNTYRKLIGEEKPDMVITYSIKPNIYAGLVCASKGIPYCANVQGLGTAFQKKGIASVVTLMYKAALAKARTIFFENTANAEEFVRRGIAKKGRILVLNGAGINLQDYEQKPYPADEGSVRFLFLSRIMTEKGAGEFFACAEKMKAKYGDRVTFDVVGFFDDDYKSLVDRLEQQGVITFHGFQTNPKPYYEAAHCVVMPSYHEGMSNVILEAAAIGRPVITTDIPGCREGIVDGISGLLCEARNAPSLLQAMEKVFALPHEAREAMGKEGRKLMEDKFEKSKVIQATMEGLKG